MTRLGDLIDAAARANGGRSMQVAADLATKRGAPISKSHISKNAREIETVTPQIIRGVAAGYDIPEEDVARAALEDLGFELPDFQTSPESAIRRDPTLSSEARAMLLAAIGAARSVSPAATKGVRHVLETASQPSASSQGNESQEAGLLDEAEERASLDRIESRLSPHGIGIEDADDAVDKRGRPGARGV